VSLSKALIEIAFLTISAMRDTSEMYFLDCDLALSRIPLMSKEKVSEFVSFKVSYVKFSIKLYNKILLVILCRKSKTAV